MDDDEPSVESNREARALEERLLKEKAELFELNKRAYADGWKFASLPGHKQSRWTGPQQDQFDSAVRSARQYLKPKLEAKRETGAGWGGSLD